MTDMDRPKGKPMTEKTYTDVDVDLVARAEYKHDMDAAAGSYSWDDTFAFVQRAYRDRARAGLAAFAVARPDAPNALPPSLGCPAARAQEEPLTADQLGEMSIRANIEQVEAIRHHARGYADAVAHLRDDDRYRDWWSSTGVQPDGPMRQHLADYLETVGPDGPDITAPPAPRAERGPNLPVDTKEHP